MASLALLVCFIFLTTLISGPLSLFFLYFRFYHLSMVFSLISIVFGMYWFFLVPLPICFVGLISIILGLLSIKKIFHFDE
jgi:hypothetical protein